MRNKKNDYGQGYQPEWEDAGEKGYKFRFRFLIGAAAVLAAIVGVASFFLLSTKMQTQKYNSYLTKGNEYYSSGDYENAIIAYQNALETDDTKSGAYINLSIVYMAKGDYNMALDILTQGYEATGSGDIGERVNEMNGLVNKLQEAQFTREEIILLAQNVTVENTAFDMVSQYTYTDYYRDFGSAAKSEKTGDTVEIYYESAGMHTFYYNIQDEIVLDADGTAPLASAKPCYVQFDKVSALLGSSEEAYAVSREKLEEIFGSQTEFYQDSSDGNYYMSAEYKNCIVTIRTDENGDVVSGEAWNRLEPLYRQETEEMDENTGKISGYVQDAVTGAGMRAALKIREHNSRTGTVLDELASGTDGSYTCEGKAGKYTVEASAAGYITEYFDIEIKAGQIKTGENFVLSPEIASGEIRIVLTWGAAPTDLDGHTEGISSTGKSFHIYWSNRKEDGIGTLDVDDTNGYGPETTTVADAGAEFTYSVYDFTGSGTMGSSGAEVKVYLPGSAQPVVYSVPEGSGNCWTVFKYENGAVTPVQTME